MLPVLARMPQTQDCDDVALDGVSNFVITNQHAPYLHWGKLIQFLADAGMHGKLRNARNNS